MSDHPLEPASAFQSGGGPAETASKAALTQLGQQYLNQTQPWVRFISILVFVGAAFMALAGLAMMMITMAGGLALNRANPVFGAIGGALVGIFYLALACLYVAPGVYLHRYAGAIKHLKSTCTDSGLEDVLKHQRSFWRFVGILSIVGLAVGVIVIVLAVVAGLMGAMMTGRR